MNNVELPSSFVKLIFAFSDIFSKPNLKHFLHVTSGLILTKQKRKTITAMVKTHGLMKTFTNVHRFFYRYKWCPHQVGLKLLGLIQGTFKPRTLTLALDDTLVRKQGPSIHGRCLHFNHAHKENTPRYIKGHNWVVCGALVYLKVFKRWFCLPFLTRLFITQEVIGDPARFKSRIALAVDMLKQIQEQVDCLITLVADGLYAKRDLIRHCIKHTITLISRMRCDAVLYLPAPRPEKPTRGRPRKYGNRLSLKQLAQDVKKFSMITVPLYGEKHTVRVRIIDALWKPADAIIRVYIVRYPTIKNDKTVEQIGFFFSTDTTLAAEKALPLIAARWSIETTFKDLKEHFALNDWQVRKEKSVTRSAAISCVAQSLLLLWTYQEVNKKQLDLWDTLPWYTHKKTISTSDMIKYFKNKSIEVQIKTLLASEPISAQKKQEILKYCKQAA